MIYRFRHVLIAAVLGLLYSNSMPCFAAQDLAALTPSANEATVYSNISKEVARFEEEFAQLQELKAQKKEGALVERRDALSTYYDTRLKKLYKKRREALAQASRELAHFIDRRPKDPNFTPNALFLLGERLFVLQERTFFEEADSHGGGDDQVNFSKTVESYSRIVREFPKFVYLDAVLYLLAISHDYMGNEKEAFTFFSQLVTDYPKSRFVEEVWFRIGNIKFDQRQFRDAIAAYEKITIKPSSSFYERAQYKLAWSHYLLNEFPGAIAGFVDVLEYRAKSQTNVNERSSVLEAEAKEYLAFSFADLDLGEEEARFSPEEQDSGMPIFKHVEAFFEKRGQTPWERGVVLHLADILVRLSKYQGAALAFEHVLKLDPLNSENPAISSRLIAIYEEMRNPKKARLARENYIELYRKGSLFTKSMQERSDLKTLLEIRKGVRDNLFALALEYHSEAKENKKAEKSEEASKNFGKAIDFYAEYIRDFYEEDNLDQALFFLAEALFENDDFEQAAERYAQVREWPWPTESRESASLNAVYALERAIEKEQKEGRLPQFKLASFDTTQKQPNDAEWPEILTKFVNASDRLAEFYPQAEVVPAFLFESANAYAIYGNAHESDRRLKEVVAKYPQTETARIAANQILNERITQGEWEQAAKEAALFGAAKVGGNEIEFRKTELGARFKLANETFARAEAFSAELKTSDASAAYKEAARIYLQLLEDDPKSEFADKILYNSAIALQRAGDDNESERVFARLIKDYPKSELAESALWSKAQRLEERLELKEAAQTFQRFAVLFPASSNAVDALLNAGIFLEATQSYLEAARTFEKLGLSYPDRPEAPESIIKSSKLYNKAGDSLGQIRLLEAYIKRYRQDSQRLVSVIEADTILGDFYQTQAGKPGKNGQFAKTQSSAAYQDALSLFKKIPDAPVAAYYAAKAKYFLLQSDLQEFERMKIDATLGKNQGTQLTKKTAKLAELKKQFEEIIRGFAGSEWSVLSLQKVGMLYEGLFRSLLDAPCPSDVEAVDESACDEYRSLLEDKAFILEEKAIESYELAIKQAANVPNTREAVFLAGEGLNRLRPDQFPVPELPLNEATLAYFEKAPEGTLQETIAPDLDAAAESIISGDFAKAETLGRAVLVTDPQNSFAKTVLGRVFFQQGKFEASKMALEDAIARDPKNALAMLWLGHTFLKLGDKQLALGFYEKVLGLRSDIAEAYDGLGLLVLDLGDAERARSAFADAIKMKPESAAYAAHLGSAYFHQKKWSEALAEYTRAQKLDETMSILNFNFGLLYMSGTFENLDDLSRWQMSKDAFAKYIADVDVSGPQKNRIRFFTTNLEQKIFIEKQRLEREKK